uniref:Uncharacterized protein n=1 Tax=Glycine max TaxID=3847 RepID=A0A0R0ILR9_SOYBN
MIILLYYRALHKHKWLTLFTVKTVDATIMSHRIRFYLFSHPRCQEAVTQKRHAFVKRALRSTAYPSE